MIRLLEGYQATVAALVSELERSASGDRVTLRSYLIEPGESTERVLAAASGALARGASLEVAVDGTWASWLSRFWERTGTRFAAFAALAAAHPGRARATRLRVVDHSKYAIFERADGRAPLAIMGGMNLGDRFAPWRDFAVRFEGAPLVSALAASLRGEATDAVSGVKFVAAIPGARSSPVKAAFERIAEEPAYSELRIAMAYLDAVGARIIERALRRGARVELTIPARANVYNHSNLRTVARLLRSGGALSVLGCRSMLHAKALVACDASGPRLALLGSANLKRNSLLTFGELDASIDDVSFAAALAEAFDRLRAESDPIVSPRYGRLAALVEERFG